MIKLNKIKYPKLQQLLICEKYRHFYILISIYNSKNTDYILQTFNFNYIYIFFTSLFTLFAGIANESGGITFIPVQVSVTGQSGGALPTLSAQALTGTLMAQQLTATPTGTVQNSPNPAKQHRKIPQQGTPTKRAQKTGSLCLFFRKVQ